MSLTIADVVVAVKELRDRLPADFDGIPTDSLIDEVIPQVFTDRKVKGRAYVRPRSSLAPTAGEPARSLVGILKWHNSGGDLTGLFMARLRVSEATYSQVETLAILLRRLTGQVNSSAVQAWERTGLVPQ